MACSRVHKKIYTANLFPCFQYFFYHAIFSIVVYPPQHHHDFVTGIYINNVDVITNVKGLAGAEGKAGATIV
jgi:hypothetical protein